MLDFEGRRGSRRSELRGGESFRLFARALHLTLALALSRLQCCTLRVTRLRSAGLSLNSSTRCNRGRLERLRFPRSSRALTLRSHGRSSTRVCERALCSDTLELPRSFRSGCCLSERARSLRALSLHLCGRRTNTLSVCRCTVTGARSRHTSQYIETLAAQFVGACFYDALAEGRNGRSVPPRSNCNRSASSTQRGRGHARLRSAL